MLRVWISFEDCSPTAWLDFEFVETAGREFWNEKFPDAGACQLIHLVIFAVPAIEVTDDADAARVWRPDREGDTIRAALPGDVRAELFIDLFVAAFAEEMEIDVAKKIHVTQINADLDR